MIKSNKVNKKILFPKLIHADRNKLLEVSSIKLKNSQVKGNRKKQISPTKAKQNSRPKQITSTTVYLQFPIGNKSRRKYSQLNQLPYVKLNDQIGYDDGVFMKRQFCAQYKKDIRARIYKYNEERLQCMSDRIYQQKSKHQNVGVSQYKLNKTIPMKQKGDYPSELIEIKNQAKPCSVCNYLSVGNEKVTRWDNINKVDFQESNDSFFEEIVEEIKLQNRNEENT